MTPHIIWRVYVAKSLLPRERKHTVSIYRVGADTSEEAVERVRAKVINDRERAESRAVRIVGVTRFGESDSVIYDGMVTRTPAEFAAMPTLQVPNTLALQAKIKQRPRELIGRTALAYILDEDAADTAARRRIAAKFNLQPYEVRCY